MPAGFDGDASGAGWESKPTELAAGFGKDGSAGEWSSVPVPKEKIEPSPNKPSSAVSGPTEAPASWSKRTDGSELTEPATSATETHTEKNDPKLEANNPGVISKQAEGNGVLQVNGEGKHNIELGATSDTAAINGTSKEANIKMGAGEDTAFISANSSGHLDMGEGRDVFYLEGNPAEWKAEATGKDATSYTYVGPDKGNGTGNSISISSGATPRYTSELQNKELAEIAKDLGNAGIASDALSNTMAERATGEPLPGNQLQSSADTGTPGS